MGYAKRQRKMGYAKRQRGVTLSRRYDTDPPSVQGQTIPNMFDLARLAQAMQLGLVEGIPPLEYPNDNLLAATMVSLGMPPFAADQVRYNPMLRLKFCQLWAAVQLAAEGNKQAQEIVEVARATFDEQRKVGLIHDQPDMSIGFWER